MEKLNIAELLRNCPKDMELNCMMYEDVYFDYVDELNVIHCYIQNEGFKTSITFNQHGTPHSDVKSKCVIFPKDKNTWDGFQIPFKDGDILYAVDEGKEFIFILKHIFEHGRVYCYLSLKGDDLRIQEVWLTDYNPTHRLATKEEKAKLFKAIKDHGYKWNSVTKTLEALIEPQFKVGDKIKSIFNNNQYIIKGLTDTHYTLVEVTNKFKYTEPIIEDKNWELIPNKFNINTLKPFESKVLVRHNKTGIWMPAIFGGYDISSFSYYVVGGTWWQYCIPYKGNEHLRGTTDECNDYYKTWE